MIPKANDKVCPGNSRLPHGEESLYVGSQMKLVHFEFIPQSQMLSQVYYVEILKQLT
jgi:hypothetical protein